MSVIPLDFQRRCEQRWAARFAQPAPKPSSQKSEHHDERGAQTRFDNHLHPQKGKAENAAISGLESKQSISNGFVSLRGVAPNPNL
jgi:hypothetical protein